MNPTRFELVSTILFSLAVLHTFSVKRFQLLAQRFPDGSIGENFFHLLGEVEVIFGLWAGALVLYLASSSGGKAAIEFVEAQNFTEPLFVFVIMVIAGSRPCLFFVEQLIAALAKLLPVPFEAAFFFVALSFGPLLGSLFTEPAAMTVLAVMLKNRYFEKDLPERFKYLALGTLLVNVSIGGVLTPYAAPPVIMVASKWGWDLAFMLEHFGLKAVTAVLINALILTLVYRQRLSRLPRHQITKASSQPNAPWWLVLLHMAFLVLTVLTAHHAAFFIGLFLFFIGITVITGEYQEELKLREGLLVGFFLGGLVVLGGPQHWWLQPVLPSLQPGQLYLASTALTAIFDNAALTYLGSQVPDLSTSLRYALVAGAVTGGGLTVIANAPNPVGFGILQKTFSGGGISPVGLLLAALLPTLVAALAFWCLPF